MVPCGVNLPSSVQPRTSAKKSLPVTSRTAHGQSPKSPRNPQNSYFVKEQDRIAFLEHLKKWSLNHDSSLHFHGAVSLYPAVAWDTYKLGASVRCVLTDDAGPDTRRMITVRLFPPRRGSGRYRLVVRSGSGWVTAREFLSKEYAMRLQLVNRKTSPKQLRGSHVNRTFLLDANSSVDALESSRFDALGLTHSAKDTVTIRPLFRYFQQLPREMQEMILSIAIGKQEYYRPGRDLGFSTYRPPQFLSTPSPTKLTSVLSISRHFNQILTPWIYKTTNFSFETSGFTNFMWLAGPANRTFLRKITLAFGRYAMLHIIRWFAPDPVFELFDPPLNAFPNALQYLWRCQIQDLAKELTLSLLTIDINTIPQEDIPMIARVLGGCFGDVERVRFTDAGQPVLAGDKRLQGLEKDHSWAELCRAAFKRYRRAQHVDLSFSTERRNKSTKELDNDMRKNQDFFDRREIGDLNLTRRDSGVEVC